MLNLQRKHYWITGLCLTIASFLLLFIGIKAILGSHVTLKNIIAYIIFSALVGTSAATLVYFRFKIAFITFVMGFILGFSQMYSAFLNGLSGWGDLIGLFSLFTWLIIGLFSGLLLQLGYFIYKKYEKQLKLLLSKIIQKKG